MSILSTTNSGLHKELTHSILTKSFELVHKKQIIVGKKREYHYYSIDDESRMNGRFIYSTNKKEFYARVMILGYTFFFNLYTLYDAKLIVDFCKNYYKIVEGIDWPIEDEKELEKIVEVKELFDYFRNKN